MTILTRAQGCCLSALLCLAASTEGQAFNIDIGDPGLLPPSSAYGGVAGQSGYWHQSLGSGEQLVDVNGNVTAARIGSSWALLDQLNVPTSNEDERRMMSSAAVLGFGRTEFQVLFLTPGWYDVYVYCWGGPSFSNADISLATSQGFVQFATNLSLPWPGEQVRGITYVQGRVYSSGGVHVDYDIPGNGLSPISGIQIVPVPGPGGAAVLLGLGVIAARRQRR